MPGQRQRQGDIGRLLTDWGRQYAGDLLIMVGLGFVLSCILAYVALLPPTQHDYAFDQEPRQLALRGFYGVERNASFGYRWSKPQASITLPATAPAMYRLTLTAQDTPANPRPRLLVVSINGEQAQAIRLSDRPRDYTFTYQFEPGSWNPRTRNTLDIAWNMASFTPADDPRPLGIIATRVRLAPLHLPSPWQPALLMPNLLLLVVTYGGLRAARLRARWVAAMLGMLLAICAVGAIVARPTVLFLAHQPGLHPFITLAGMLALGGALPLLAPARRPRVGRALRAALAWVQGQSTTRDEAALPARATLRRDLALVFMVALGFRLVWAVVTPPWQAPDEPDHYTYAAHIAEQAEIPHPPYRAGYAAYSNESLTSWQLTLLGQISSLGQALTPELARLPVAYDYAAARDYRAADDRDRHTSAGARATPYPPLYYLVAAAPYRLAQEAPILARLYAARCASAALGALGCVFGYLMARELGRTRHWGFAVGLCMALLPMYAFVTSTVNNDAGMVLAATALIWVAARAWRQPQVDIRHAWLLGLLSGAVLLMKPTAFPVVAGIGAFLLVKAFPALRAPLRLSRPRLIALGLYVAGGVVVYGPWFLFRFASSGDIGAGQVAAPTGTGGERVLAGMIPVPPYSPGDYWEFTRQRGWEHLRWLLIESFWGLFGWLDVPLPERVYGAITLFCLIGLLGLVVGLARRAGWRSALPLLLGLVLAQVAFLFLVIDYYYIFAQTGRELGLQGRYFFPVLAPVLFLLLAGWEQLTGGRGLVLRCAPLAMLGLQLVALATVLARYYGLVIG